MEFKKRKILFVLIMLISFSLSGESPRDKKNVIKVDFSERFRLVSWKNTIALDDASDDNFLFSRHRTSIGMKFQPSKKTEVYFKVTNEFKYYFKPSGRDFNLSEVFVDNLYLRIKGTESFPVSFTIGRQNLIFGEGFILMDGNPLDGSRSIFFDALRADLKIEKIGVLTFLWFSSPEKDRFLPIINAREQAFNDRDSTGYGLYFSGNRLKTPVDLYLIRKDYSKKNGMVNLSGYNILGTKARVNFLKNFSLTAEGAYEFGNGSEYSVAALGGYFYLRYHFSRKIKFLKNLTFGGIYLSGDKKESEKYEAWEPPFSRWPKWSDSYIYTLINEGGVANWSNLSSLYIAVNAKLFKGCNLSLIWHNLRAPQNSATNLFPGGEGNSRGNLFETKFRFTFSKRLTSHLAWEHFIPGNFYFKSADSYNWFRFEMYYKIK